MRRMGMLLLAAAFLVAAFPASALGWANGADLNGDGIGDDGYGTHDWILDHAITLAGGPGSWVDRDAALLASDDPDNPGSRWASGNYHLYMETGASRGAPQAVADLYAGILADRDAGDDTGASVKLGVLSHLYGDILQPSHTYRDETAVGDSMHAAYEQYVDTKTGSYAESPSWASGRDRVAVADVRAKAVAAAKYSRSKYPTLRAPYAASRTLSSAQQDAVSSAVLGRAVNDIADIVAAVPTGKGAAPAPASIDHRMGDPRYYYPRNGQKVSATAVARDSAGRPMEGLALSFGWPSGKTVVAYTDANGLAYDWQTLSGWSYSVFRPTTATYSSGGASVSDGSGFRVTPVVGAGQAGILTAVTPTRPKRGTTVKVTTRIRDTAGRPIGGIPVTFTWYHKGKSYTTRVTTGSTGYATSYRNIGRAAVGYRVYVKGQAYCGGSSRSSKASFVTQP